MTDGAIWRITGGVTRRLLLGGLVVAVVAAGLVAFAQGASYRPSSGGRYVDSAGWSLSYPRGLYLEHADSGPGRAEFHEVTIASFQPRRGIQTGKTRNGGNIRFVAPATRLPANGVVLRIWSVTGPRSYDEGPDSRFPITRASFTRPDLALGLPHARDRTISADGLTYTAALLIAPHAPPALRAALARVLASLRFSRQHPGRTVGNRQYVLQTPGRYPAGSFTLVHAPGGICNGSPLRCHSGRAPLYLVHANWTLARNIRRSRCEQAANTCVPMGSFYALGWKQEAVPGGYTSQCALLVDLAKRQFYCANLDARWDRFGRTLRRPPGATVDDDLSVIAAKISWAGYVILS